MIGNEDSFFLDFLKEHDFINTIFEEKISLAEDELDLDIYEISKSESEEMFEQIIPLVEQINKTGLDIEKSKELKRYLHTFKGSVRMAGANKLGMLAHRLETLLDYVENRKINLYNIKSLLDLELNKISFLMKDPTQILNSDKLVWLNNIVKSDDVATKVSIDSLEELAEVNKGIVSIQNKSEQKKETKQYIRILSNIIDSAINDAGEIRLSRTSLEDSTSNNRKSITDLKNSSSKLLKMVKEIEVHAESQIQARHTELEESGSEFDPLEFDRFTRLQELTRLMNEAVSDIEETISSLILSAKIQDVTINQQSIVTNNLLTQLMKVRLVPFESQAEKFYAIARKTSKEIGKKLSLEFFGEKTEMDKLILDKVTDSIAHLLRNSMAHGIEMPEERKLAGKPVIGKIKIDVSLEGNFTIIKLSDDGAGINVEKVREIGIKKGLIKEEVNYSKEELINLIFHSGFSTADTISQTSGRGVGMDVVKNDITSLGGSVKIETEQGKGTTFILTLPMKVATSQSMLCNVRDKLMAIPAILIEEVISIKEKELKAAYSNGKIKLGEVEYPFYYSGHLLGIVDSDSKPESRIYNSIVRVKYVDESIVLHVDKLLTTTEILIKSPGAIYNKITGILGVTLLGDGRQGVVVNPIKLLTHYEQYYKSVKIKVDNEANNKTNSRITVMVVDDSLTVRRISSKLLERNNFNVMLAKDGEDALEQLQIAMPNIILSDIEMPRMDGFEFVKNVRSLDKYSNIPILMISSRTADKHQQHAFYLGANDFLGKPYKEEELIEKIQNLLDKNKELI